MEKKSQNSDAKKVQVIPADVRAGQIISMVEVTGGLGTVIDVSRLADELGANVAVMLPILETAELLGLVKSEKGEISLTEFGLKFQKTSKNKVRLLTDQLAKIEPFKTTAELAARYGEVTTSQVARSLAERGISWHHDPELNESLLRALLIHWALYAGLLTYNKNGNFERTRR